MLATEFGHLSFARRYEPSKKSADVLLTRRTRMAEEGEMEMRDERDG
jgi:hypothetical protein